MSLTLRKMRADARLQTGKMSAQMKMERRERMDANATAAMRGMLAHSRRYRPREKDQHMHWHKALATEAYDIAKAMEEAREERRVTDEQVEAKKPVRVRA